MDENNSTQDLIAKAMHYIATSRPPEGMDSRLKARLGESSASRVAPQTFRWKIAASVALAGVAACVFFYHPAANMPQQNTPPAAVHPLAGSQPPATLAFPERQPDPRVIAPRKKLHNRYDARLDSYPAPPQPLTEEEKLLLRAVQQHQPATMAALSLIASNGNSVATFPSSGDHE